MRISRQKCESSKTRSRPICAPWIVKLVKNARRRQLLRKRDGDNCWYCGGPLSFEPRDPPCSDYASLEHVIDKKHGGGNQLWNLVLAHRTCNTKASKYSLLQKFKSRVGRHRNQKRILPKTLDWLEVIIEEYGSD